MFVERVHDGLAASGLKVFRITSAGLALAYNTAVGNADDPQRNAATIALADAATFVFRDYVVVEVLALGWFGHQHFVYRLRYVEIAEDRSALNLHLKHMSDGVVSDRFQIS
jgi:hypothetical protein